MAGSVAIAGELLLASRITVEPRRNTRQTARRV